jgi:ferritin-like metal-binding protein YciE
MATDTSRRNELYVTGLKNAHAMEMQALAIMKPQAERIDSYPDVEAKLRQHIAETEQQAQRIENLLDACGADRSALKDMALSMAGGMAALGHMPAGDEILKNAFADFAFENYEIAAYRSLIALAEAAGHSEAIGTLQQNLDEEERMAEWIEQNLANLTQKFVSLSEAGVSAKK